MMKICKCPKFSNHSPYSKLEKVKTLVKEVILDTQLTAINLFMR